MDVYNDISIGTAVCKLAQNFLKSMICWARSGFLVVPYSIVWKRRLICKICTKGVGKRCPSCGCFIWAITKLGTARCDNWDQFLENDPYELTTNFYSLQRIGPRKT